jgi:hypothetical protein
MPDLKQISDEIAQAIFDRIEQDRTLILSNVADVIHRELAVRMPAQKEPEPVVSKSEKAKAEMWKQMKEFMDRSALYPPAPQEMTATAVREREQEEEREARRRATIRQKLIERLSDGYDPRWIAWDFAGKRREIS